ncbi:transcriptional repressor scratch 1 isoform X1 [Cricetulus griseus]|uniref:transcriptional repressor scratch 1 isoform X1 n=1 Tax=Cricetulus griseus TaxID=10029 RepID=UPI0007DAA5FC|nr:transcriptional repressor scratch 1 isoform X1 [Cricetulus griseus]
MPRSFLVKKVKLDTFSSADLDSSYGRARSDLGVRLQDKGYLSDYVGPASVYDGDTEAALLKGPSPEPMYAAAVRGELGPAASGSRSNLRAHMQTHSAFKHFQCKRCKKSFALKSYLNKHYESACFKGGAGGPATPAPPQLSPVQA